MTAAVRYASDSEKVEDMRAVGIYVSVGFEDVVVAERGDDDKRSNANVCMDGWCQRKRMDCAAGRGAKDCKLTKRLDYRESEKKENWKREVLNSRKTK